MADDDRLLLAYVWEAARFKLLTPMIIRSCDRPATLASGTDRDTNIPAGTQVYATLLSAMFDLEAMPYSDEFRPDRPESGYLLFG